MKQYPYDYESPKSSYVPPPNQDAFAVVRLKQAAKQFGMWHPTLREAKAEAERLARQTGEAFGVLALVGVMQPVQVEWRAQGPDREQF